MGLPMRACAAAAAITALVGLTACSGGDDTRPSAEATSLPHDQASDGGPGAGSDQSSHVHFEHENPKHFITRWAAAESRMQNTGRVAPYLALSRQCRACHQLAHTVARYYSAGGFIHGGAWEVDSIKAIPASSGLATYIVRGHAAPMTVRESSSGAVQHVAATRVVYMIGLMAKGSSFTVGSRTRGF